jgi:hypothetical protein
MTEEEAIAEVVEWINAGHRLLFWEPAPLPYLPYSRKGFIWCPINRPISGQHTRGVIVHQPAAAIREVAGSEWRDLMVKTGRDPAEINRLLSVPGWFCYEFAID